jgi:5-methyltetrahydropteroyltriglutamate--homocysteine methyltransferase
VSARSGELPLASKALGIVTAGLRGRVRTWTHICYGEFEPVLDAIFALPVDGFLLELSNSGFDLLAGLKRLPQDKILGAGVLDVHSHRIENANEVRERIEKIVRVVPAERVWINPDCGLKTRTEAEARGKLESMMAAVRSLRGS